MRLHLNVPHGIAVLCLLLATNFAQAQGTFRTVTFDGFPVIPPGSDVGVTNYSESGMRFTPIDVGEQFVRSGGGREGFPQNGTGYILNGFFTSLSGSRGSTHFGLSSVDLAEFSTLYSFPRTIQFIGYRPDGTTLTTEFATDGIIDGTGPLSDFQTFYFSDEFADLVRFEVASQVYALDNLVFFDVIPEPGTWAFLVLGGVLAGCRFWKSRRGR